VTEQSENDFKRGVVEGERLHLEKDLTLQIDSAHDKIRRIDNQISKRDKDDVKVKTELVVAVRGLNKAVDSINKKFDGLQDDISQVKQDVGIIKGRRDFSG
jgi:predicted transcriptional regulator